MPSTSSCLGPRLELQHDHFRHIDLRLLRQRLFNSGRQPLAVQPGPIHAFVDDHKSPLRRIHTHPQMFARDFVVGVKRQADLRSISAAANADLILRHQEELRTGIVDATIASDVDALGQLVDQALALSTLDESFVQVLAPALVEVGERWASGAVSVAQEHLVSSTVRAALQTLLSDQRADVHGTAVLACAPGERHEIGLLMLAVLLRSDGWQVAYLGADTPFADAVSLADRLDATALCFSAASKESARALDRELARTPPRGSLTVVVGGRGTKKTDARDTVAQLRKLAA